MLHIRTSAKPVLLRARAARFAETNPDASRGVPRFSVPFYRYSLVLALLMLWGSALTANERAPTVVIKATLQEQSPLPAPADIFVYREGLVTYRYRVDQVVSGTLAQREILVTHWGVRHGMVQPISALTPDATVTLKLAPFDDFREERLDEVFRTDLSHPHLEVFHDVGQELVAPVRGRWDYGVELSRSMRAFHALKQQLKLVVLGDCQTWFSIHPAMLYPEENKRTPVALGMTQERSDLPLYRILVDNYVSQLPNLEWVVVGWHTRWVNDRARWRAQDSKTRDFVNSTGFAFDRDNAAAVWAEVNAGEAISLQQLQQDKDLWREWQESPFGARINIANADSNAQRGVQREASRARANYRFSEKRWQLWTEIVQRIIASDAKVLVYTLPIHPATGDQDVKDKQGTTASGYQHQVEMMRQMEKRFSDQFFFYDLNQAGNHDLRPEYFVNMDHLSSAGAALVSAKIEAQRQEIVQRLAPEEAPVDSEKDPGTPADTEAAAGPDADMAARYTQWLQERLTAQVAEGTRVRFVMQHLFRGQEVSIEKVDSDGAWVSNGPMSAKIALWQVLPDGDRAALSRSLAARSSHPQDAALAAYYSFAAGEPGEARRYLTRAGDHAAEITDAFGQ